MNDWEAVFSLTNVFGEALFVYVARRGEVDVIVADLVPFVDFSGVQVER